MTLIVSVRSVQTTHGGTKKSRIGILSEMKMIEGDTTAKGKSMRKLQGVREDLIISLKHIFK